MSCFTEQDEQWMHHALALARRGRGDVEPNPLVGCVIVRQGQIISEGYHASFGGPHAEAAALAGRPDVQGGTAYVTLEPCCHLDKKTPPCVPLLIAANLKRVVVACEDPNPRVAGSGITQLREAGIEVEVGLLQAEARQVNAAFFARQLYSRPYVTLKWAQSADGKVAGEGGRRTTISNAASMRVVHDLRGRCDAILVAINTVLADDPVLTTRPPPPRRVLIRVVLDRDGKLPADCRLMRTRDQAPLLVYQKETLTEVLSDLAKRGVTHLIVEPGPRLARKFLDQNLADRVWVFRSSNRMNADSAPAAVTVPFAPTSSVDLEGDLLTEYLNPGSDVFFARTTSADFPEFDGSTAKGGD